MPKQYLAEGITGATKFVVDREAFAKSVVESLPNGQKGRRIPGRLSVCDSVNGNNRRYRRVVWEKNLSEGSRLMDLISENAAFGLLEHPEDGMVTLESPIAVMTVDAKLTEGGEVHGEILVLETEHGKKLQALIEAGYNPMVSSRGFGSVIEGVDGVAEVQDDYICEGWDVVSVPSFKEAKLSPQRESDEGKSGEQGKPLREDKTGEKSEVDHDVLAKADPTEPEEKPKKAPEKAKETPANQNESIMNIQEIKSRIATLKGIDVTKMGPKAFAESLSESQALHGEIAAYVAEDGKRSYEGHKLHGELESLEETWNARQAAPSASVKKLKEDRNKTLKVLNTVIERAQSFRTSASKALTEAEQTKELLGKVTENGKKWKALAEKRKQELSTLQTKYITACEALDKMANTYKTDMSVLGAKLAETQLAEHLTDEDRKALKEAVASKKPAKVLEARAAIEKRITKVQESKGNLQEEGGSSKACDPDLKNVPSGNAPSNDVAPKPNKDKENLKGKGKNESQAGKSGLKPLKEANSTAGRPGGVNESIEMVKRLSGVKG